MLEIKVDEKNLEAISQTLAEMPKQIKRATSDALSYVRNKFFKAFKANTGVNMRNLGPKTMWWGFKKRVSYSNAEKEFARLRIYSKSEVAAMHEFGGTVRSDSGKMLMVPLPSAKAEINQYFNRKETGGEWVPSPGVKKNLIVLKGGGNTRTLAVIRDGVIPLFALKGEVRIRQRLKFYDTWESVKEPAFEGAADRIFNAVINYWNNPEWKFSKKKAPA